MAHLIIFYNIAILFILFISFNIPVFIYFKTKDRFLAHYIVFFLPFIFYTLFLMSFLYIGINIKSISFNVYIFILYGSEFFFILMMFSVVFFWHYVFNVENKKLKNIILLILSLFLMAIFPFHSHFKVENNIIYGSNNILGLFSTAAFLISLFYVFYVAFRRFKDIKNSEIKKMIKMVIILTMVFLPGIIFDFYHKVAYLWEDFIVNLNNLGIEKDGTFFLIHPVFYCMISITCTYYIIRYYFKEYNIIINEIPIDMFVKKFNISTREKDVLELLITGKSNSEIADKLFISINTVKTHIKNIYEKFSINNRYELISLIKNFQ